MPAMKLESTVKAGSKVIEKDDAPRRPCQHLLEPEALPPGAKAELTLLCGLYNPVPLRHNANKAVLFLTEGKRRPKVVFF
jgi:hypothetical protein